MFPGEHFGSIWRKTDISPQKWEELLSHRNPDTILCQSRQQGSDFIGLFNAQDLAKAQVDGYTPLSDRELAIISQENQPGLGFQGAVWEATSINPSESKSLEPTDEQITRPPLNLPPAKRRKIDDLPDTIISQMQKLFPGQEIKGTTVEELYRHGCLLLEDFVLQPHYINTKQLKQIYSLFFQTGLKKFSHLEAPGHTCQMMKDLYECTLDLDVDAPNNPRIEEPEDVGVTLKVLIVKKFDPASQIYNIKRWVFKPERPPGLRGATLIPCFLQPKRELMAHLVNFHHQFPIPTTYLLRFNGTNYSIHDYIDGRVGLTEMEKKPPGSSSSDQLNIHPGNSKSSDSQEFLVGYLLEATKEELPEMGKASSGSSPSNQPNISSGYSNSSGSRDSSSDYLAMQEENFHKLLVFDILFSNGDRNEDNLIFVEQENDLHSVMGIDHGDCMIDETNKLTIKYVTLKIFERPLDKAALALVTEEYENKYAELMQKSGFEIPLTAIKWMHLSCCAIRRAGNYESITARDLFNVLNYFQQTYLLEDLDKLRELLQETLHMFNSFNIYIDEFNMKKEIAWQEVLQKIGAGGSHLKESLMEIFNHQTFKKGCLGINF